MRQRYNFKDMNIGDVYFAEGQKINGNAYTNAMRVHKKYGIKFQGETVPGGIIIRCTYRPTCIKSPDERLIDAMVDWGSFPDVMTSRTLVRLCRKVITELPLGNAGKVAAGRLISSTGKYRREKVHHHGKQYRLYVHCGVVETGAKLKEFVKL